MAGVTYGNKLYNDLKGSLPDEVFKKKYGHLKAAPVAVPAVKQKKSTGLGGDKLSTYIKEDKARRKMFGANDTGIVNAKSVARKI